MVKVKNLENGQDVYLVNVEEKSIYCGSIVKKPHEATVFVSTCGDIKVKVKDFDELIFSSVEEAEYYLFEKIDKNALKSLVKDEYKEGCTEEEPDNEDEIDPRSDLVLELEKDECLDDISVLVEKLDKKDVLNGIVVTVVSYEGDVVYVPVYRNKKIGQVHCSYDLAFASIVGFNDACAAIGQLLNLGAL